jgi:hypothetical protein
MRNFDPLVSVEIASQNPTKVGVYSAISVNIKCNTSLEKLPSVIDSITGLPYMTQILNIDTNKVGESYQHQLNLRLYVQEPFHTP